jgi:predicted dehydrogenase
LGLQPPRLLVVGAGLIGARHIALIKSLPNVELAGVVDPDPARGAEFAELADVGVDVDGVVLATPTPLHADHAEAIAARGWPMLIEKPIADDPHDAARIVTLAERVSVLIGHHRRYHPRVAALKAALPEIGSVVTLSCLWAVRKPEAYFDTWRDVVAGSPVRINLVHDLDLLRYLIGEIREVSGFAAQTVRQAGRVESGAVALRFDGGATATISFADCAPSPWGFEAGTGENPNIGSTGQDMMWITGTKGGISFPSLTLWRGTEWGEPARPVPHAPVPGVPPLALQMQHFADVIAGRAAPLVSAVEGALTLEATLSVEAALKS